MKLKLTLITLFISTIISTASSQSLQDTIIISSGSDVERISRDLDSLTNSWYVKLALQNQNLRVTGDSNLVEYPDSVYRERLRRINSIIHLPYNSIIRNHIHVYTIKKVEKFRAMLGMMDYYFPMIEDIFDAYGLPAELKYMAVIESALNPTAVSRMGATGLWQFMYSTGKMYGLTINSVVDERRDPLKATVAAARYLKDLYNIFQDWTLVIAAYNCGPGNVNKAIRRSGNKKDYWEIYYRLPRETRGYLPQYVAATYGMNYYREHNIRPYPLNIPVSRDTIVINKDIHLSQISGVMGIPLGELQAMNPQYRTGLVPGSSKPQVLTLPMNHLGDFIDLNDTIRNYKPEIYLSKSTKIDDPTRTVYTPDIKGKTKLLYTVKEGDNLGFISEWYRVSLAELRSWNNIYRNTIRIGQKLVIYVDPSKSEYFSLINKMTLEEKQAMSGKSIPLNTKSVATASPATPATVEGEFEVYTVKKGDTLWDIARMYNTTTTDVLNLNGISEAGKISVGQKLKIRRKS